MIYESKIKWMEYPQHKPQCEGYYMAIQGNVVGCGFFSMSSGKWGAFLNETEEDSNPEITYWAYFPDAVPAQLKTEQKDKA